MKTFYVMIAGQGDEDTHTEEIEADDISDARVKADEKWRGRILAIWEAGDD